MKTFTQHEPKLLWDASWITNTQLTQTLKFHHDNNLANNRGKHTLKQDNSQP